MSRRSEDQNIGSPYERSEESRRSSRQTRTPYDRAVEDMVSFVINYWRKAAPETPDDAAATDQIAEQITPSTDRNCAAVFAVAQGLPLVAMNSWNDYLVEGGGTSNHAQVYASGAYQKVQFTQAQLHAEMKILQYCFTSKYSGPYYYIGISKRCCLRCAVVMQIQGFSSRGCSGGLWDAGWGIPPFVRNDTTKLTAFMGGVAYDWYKGLESNQKSDFLLRLQNAKD